MTQKEFEKQCPVFPSFPNYTKEMYEGNKPSGKGHQMVSGGYSDRWTCRYGGGETYNGQIINAEYNINHKIVIMIIGDVINIIDNRYSGKSDEWCYCNKEGHKIHGCAKAYLHDLEPEKIVSILNSEFDSVFGKMVQERAKELCEINYI